jgi:hypothetical protein
MKHWSMLIVTLLLYMHAAHAQDTIRVANALWMPKAYLDARTQHSPQDAFWKTADFSKYLSPVTSIQTYHHQLLVHTYSADNFPIRIKRSLSSPNRKEWILDEPVFSGNEGAPYKNATFSLISHNNDPQDLWLGITRSGQRDSVQFAAVPKSTDNAPLWMHATNYLSYYFKGKHFDVYDDKGQLLYSNVQTDSSGVLHGFPGYKHWDVTSANTFQLTSDKPGDVNFVNFNIKFTGEDITLQPVEQNGALHQSLLFKEKPLVP